MPMPEWNEITFDSRPYELKVGGDLQIEGALTIGNGNGIDPGPPDADRGDAIPTLELIPHVVSGDVMTASSFNHIIDIINGQLSRVPWVCPYCQTMNEGAVLECKSCRASRKEVA